MDATFNHTCTQELVVHTVVMIAVAVTLRFALFGCSGVAAHKGAYGALFKVRCMVAEHMARAPLGALNERRTGDIKTVLNEDIEKLELFLAHNLPDLVCYLVGPVVIFIYLMTVNIPLALISLVPLILAVVVMGMMFRNTDDLMERANHSITTLNSVMIEYISGMKLIKAYNMGSKSFQKFSDAIQEENAMWNETSRRMGPPYAAFVVIIECGMLMMVPIGGMFFLKGSLAASTLLLFLYVGSMYLTEIRPLQELGTNFANVLNAITKTKEILDIPIYEPSYFKRLSSPVTVCWKISAWVVTLLWKKCGLLQKRHRLMTLSCPCRMDMTQKWAVSAHAFLAEKNSGLRLPVQF